MCGPCSQVLQVSFHGWRASVAIYGAQTCSDQIPGVRRWNDSRCRWRNRVSWRQLGSRVRTWMLARARWPSTASVRYLQWSRAHARGAGKFMFMQSATDRATPWDGRRFGVRKGETLAGIGEIQTAHATNTLQGCHPSAASLPVAAGRAVPQVPQHEGGVPELQGRSDTLDQPPRPHPEGCV